MKRIRRQPPTSIADLLERAIPEPNTGCWLWLHATNSDGYAQIYYHGAVRSGHRVAYELSRGPVAGWLCVLHSCDTPLCVNPDHLFLGTQAENVEDMIQKGRRSPRWRWMGGGCSSGHDMADEVNVMHRSDGHIQCRTCKNERRRVPRTAMVS